MSDSAILAGNNNQITDSVRCTIINGANNVISGKTNSHILGNNITADASNTFYVGCNLDVSGDIYCDNIYAEGDVIASYTSDKRLKDNIAPLDDCLNNILALKPVEFDWNKKQNTYEGHDIGLIAQQVQKVLPEIVSKKKSGYLGIHYEKLIPVLIGATQEQDLQIQELEREVKELIKKSKS